MDKLAEFNQERWTELVKAGIAYSRAFDNFDEAKARAYLNRWGIIEQIGLTDFAGKDILCLASGGGQQSVCFGLLGANVTVVDFTPAQLDKDREMAAKYGLDVRIEQADMRDLSLFADASFDIVYQPYSINFVPDPLPVLAEAARVLRADGLYYLQYGNPLWNMEETDWDGKGYPILQPYRQGNASTPEELPWDVEQSDGTIKQVEGPKEFTHTLSTLVNGLGSNGLHIFAMFEGPDGDDSAEPGSWEHMQTYIPIWPAFWSRKIK